MKLELGAGSEGKIDELLEQLSTQYDLADLTAEELLDALLSLAVEMFVSDETAMPIAKARLIEYLGKEVMARHRLL